MPSDLTVEEALDGIQTQASVDLETEEVPVADALHRIIAVDTPAQQDIPRFDNSAMDGYIFLSSDLAANQRSFPVAGEIRPENKQPAPLNPGYCKRIMTGAPLPEGDYQIVPVEQVSEGSEKVEILELPKRSPVRHRGEGYRKGVTVLEEGSLIRAYELGLLIESGNSHCTVYRPIQIAVQVTGSEIGEDMDSNGPVLESLASMWPGVHVSRWPVLEDEPKQVVRRMSELKESVDLVLTTGGISAGRHDYIYQAMNKLGAETLVRKVKQKPGKPFTVTTLDGVPFFHLPGNPVSAVFTAEYYVRSFVLHQLGLPARRLKAVTDSEIGNHRNDRTLFVTGTLSSDSHNRLTISAKEKMQSHLMQLYRNQNAYAELKPDTTYKPGETVDVTLFTHPCFNLDK